MPDIFDQYASPRPTAQPMIYAYQDHVPEHRGLLKVGYTANDVDTRVAQQFPTKTPDGKKPYDIVFREEAMYDDGSSFTDHDVHRILERRGFHRLNGSEWFRCSVQDVRAAVVALKSHTLNLENRTQTFKMRPEQERAVEMTRHYFQEETAMDPDRTPKFLWNCKMRFGKTFAAYELAKRMGMKRILVLTFKPAVENAWEEDLNSHVDFEGWQFYSRNSAAATGITPDRLNQKKPIVCFGSFQDFLGTNENGGIKAIESLLDTLDLTIANEEAPVYDTRKLPLSVKERFDFYSSVIKKVSAIYGPDYLALSSKAPKPELEEILSESKMARATLWKIIRIYLQSGFNLYSLIDKRTDSGRKEWKYEKKPGRKTSYGLSFGTVIDEKTKEKFKEGLDYYKSGRAKTYEDAYDFLCLKYYGTYEQTPEGVVKTLLPASARPTFRQFYYYCKMNITSEEVDAIKTSRQEQRNNKRLLFSDSLKGINGPWDCFEMDEVEVDLSLVSVDDPTKVVGRPIVYVMLDVYTRMIAAVSIAFDNNSVLGFTNCLMNLADDKVEYCKKYGLTITENIWPSGYLPLRIRCDRGAEYRSKRVNQICRELGINIQLVTAGTGSLKGNVEQLFHIMHSAQNPDLENKGLIEKRYDSMHHKEARLNIDDFTKMFLNFVVTYNQHYFKNYPLTKDMLTNNVRPIPIELWKYGTSANGFPMPISNKNQFFYALLTPVNARISRAGVVFDGLYYVNYGDRDFLQTMYISGTKRIPFECRIDERDITNIYYLRDGKLCAAPLNSERTGNSDYAGLTYAEYKALKKEKKRMDFDGTEHNRQIRVARKELNKAVIDSADERQKNVVAEVNDTEELRKNRRIEQQEIANKNSLESHMPVATFEDTSWQGKPSDFATDIDMDDWESALALFD